MHELAMAQGILKAALQLAAERGEGGLARVQVELGPLAAPEAAGIERCFEMLARGTAAEAAQLELTIRPLVGVCQSCGERVPPPASSEALACPACGSEAVEVDAGEDWCLKSVEKKKE